VIIGGTLFGMFAGINYWWPKAFGFKLDRVWGKRSFWLWVVGFWCAFAPLYALGLMGVTRRLGHLDDTAYQPFFQFAAFGALLIAAGIGSMFMQFYVSIRDREQLRDWTGDPWDGRTLEWSTSSPPPDYNFAFSPIVYDNDAWWDMKQRGYHRPTEGFRPIHMPKNTGTGVVIAALSVGLGFAMIWYIWWLAIVSMLGIFVVAIGHSFIYKRDFHIPVEDVIRIEDERTRILAAEGVPA
jgi:cytochrome o ubiquinol oxidase subunit 1